MAQYQSGEMSFIKKGEKIIFDNKCESPMSVGAAIMFRHDGIYIVDVHNGKYLIKEADQLKRAKWLKDSNGATLCSNCEQYAYDENHIFTSTYCPWCGAKMENV